MSSAAIVTFVYAALVLMGGIMGMVKAGSAMSLVGGGVSAVLLAIAGVGFNKKAGWAMPLAIFVIVAMLGFFGRSLGSDDPAKQGRAIGMVALSVLTLVALLITARKR